MDGMTGWMTTSTGDVIVIGDDGCFEMTGFKGEIKNRKKKKRKRGKKE